MGMKGCFPWKDEYISNCLQTTVGNPWGLVYVKFTAKDGEIRWLPVSVEIDSGALISVFKRSLGDLVLPQGVESGKSKWLSGVGGGIDTYIHTITLWIGPFVFPVRVAFAKDENSLSKNLLGRLDVFSRFKITFDHIGRQTFFE